MIALERVNDILRGVFVSEPPIIGYKIKKITHRSGQDVQFWPEGQFRGDKLTMRTGCFVWKSETDEKTINLHSFIADRICGTADDNYICQNNHLDKDGEMTKTVLLVNCAMKKGQIGKSIKPKDIAVERNNTPAFIFFLELRKGNRYFVEGIKVADLQQIAGNNKRCICYIYRDNYDAVQSKLYYVKSWQLLGINRLGMSGRRLNKLQDLPLKETFLQGRYKSHASLSKVKLGANMIICKFFNLKKPTFFEYLQIGGKGDGYLCDNLSQLICTECIKYMDDDCCKPCRDDITSISYSKKKDIKDLGKLTHKINFSQYDGRIPMDGPWLKYTIYLYTNTEHESGFFKFRAKLVIKPTKETEKEREIICPCAWYLYYTRNTHRSEQNESVCSNMYYVPESYRSHIPPNNQLEQLDPNMYYHSGGKKLIVPKYQHKIANATKKAKKRKRESDILSRKKSRDSSDDNESFEGDEKEDLIHFWENYGSQDTNNELPMENVSDDGGYVKEDIGQVCINYFLFFFLQCILLSYSLYFLM